MLLSLRELAADIAYQMARPESNGGFWVHVTRPDRNTHVISVGGYSVATIKVANGQINTVFELHPDNHDVAHSDTHIQNARQVYRAARDAVLQRRFGLTEEIA